MRAAYVPTLGPPAAAIASKDGPTPQPVPPTRSIRSCFGTRSASAVCEENPEHRAPAFAGMTAVLGEQGRTAGAVGDVGIRPESDGLKAQTSGCKLANLLALAKVTSSLAS
jgi:hypothetical protein